ncbi:helix-turn-helix domain-containing protein [Paenibacillus humicola]|uniref:helix-turn-helix domain-containing protein n=1 Tax=Paenibacillus humicola TaxID=3110540 RepID=UPI00237B4DB4|nr:XRE family transcriptional regulator [Paenibacillus humicola]
MEDQTEHIDERMKGLVRSIGSILRRTRKERGLSMEELAGRSGVSKLTLGKIERGETNPSLSVLWRIADGLSVPLSFLLQDEQPAEVSRSGEGVHFTDGPWRVEPMFGSSAGSRTETYRAFLQPHSFYEPEAHPAGTIETAAVMSGTVTITVAGTNHRLGLYDALRFRADAAHLYRNDTDRPAVLHLTIEYSEL